MGLFRLRAERPKTTSRLADDAASVLEERGLGRFSLQDGAGRPCLFGALNIADHGHYSHNGANTHRVLAVAWRVSPTYRPDQWSNAQADAGPAIARLRDVARTAREEELAAARAHAMGGVFARARSVESSHPARAVGDGGRQQRALGDGRGGVADIVDAPWFREELDEAEVPCGRLEDLMV